MSELTIVHQVEKCGWSVTPMEGGWSLLHPQTRQVVFMSITEYWLCFSSLLAGQDQPLDQLSLPDRVALLEHLLQRNERMFMTKFSLDNAGLPLLMVEIPRKFFSYPLLNKALGSLSCYAATTSPVQQDNNSLLTSARPQPDTYGYSADEQEAGLSKETFRRYINGLKGTGWGLRNNLRAFPWHIGYKNALRIYEVYCTISRNWVSFQAPLLLDQAETVLTAGLQEQAFFMHYLLRLNNIWFITKIGINAQKQVLLLVECPTEVFDFSLLKFMTRTISAYIDSYSQEIQIMATLQKDPRLIELLNVSVP